MGLLLVCLTAYMAFDLVREHRIGRGLIFDGTPAQALLVSAERIERSQCSRSQRFICTQSDNYIGIVVHQVGGLRWGAEFRLTLDEFTAHGAGEEVFVDLIYLPSDPIRVERTRGTRLAAAERDTPFVAILAAFGLISTAIGGFILRRTRKPAAPPSTDPDA
ncbi:hypothetical protein [Gymnodinialimonas sp.]